MPGNSTTAAWLLLCVLLASDLAPTSLAAGRSLLHRRQRGTKKGQLPSSKVQQGARSSASKPFSAELMRIMETANTAVDPSSPSLPSPPSLPESELGESEGLPHPLLPPSAPPQPPLNTPIKVVYTEDFEEPDQFDDGIYYNDTIIQAPTAYDPDFDTEEAVGFVHGGLYSLGVQMPATGITESTDPDAIYFGSRHSYLPTGSQYKYCLWARYYGHSPFSYHIPFSVVSSASEGHVQHTSNVTLSSQWEELCVSFAPASAGWYWFRLGLAIFEGAWVDIDDITLTEQALQAGADA